MGEVQQYVWLNNQKLPIEGSVAWQRITPFPNQLMMSAPCVSDYTPTSKQSWDKLKSGMGLEKWTAQDNDRYWEADGVDASINMQSLAPLVTTMGSFGAQPVKLIKFNNQIWAIGNNMIAYWTGTAWIPANPTPPLSNPTDAVTFYGTVT